MNYNEAIEYIKVAPGNKIKLPEWIGFWEYDILMAQVVASTRTGDASYTPYLDDYKNRTDWGVTDGSRDFGGALVALKAGKYAYRKGWDDRKTYLFLVSSDISLPNFGRYATTNYSVDEYKPLSFIALKTIEDTVVPWIPSQMDLLSEDYFIH